MIFPKTKNNFGSTQDGNALGALFILENKGILFMLYIPIFVNILRILHCSKQLLNMFLHQFMKTFNEAQLRSKIYEKLLHVHYTYTACKAFKTLFCFVFGIFDKICHGAFEPTLKNITHLKEKKTKKKAIKCIIHCKKESC